MQNHRGITVSSAIGTIAEEIVFNRVSNMVQFTQAQAGGIKGGSTADHVFILRNIIAITMKQKRNTIITFYDVVKAFDRADMDDMLVTMNNYGVTGKVWRLMKALNQGLKARVNTKAGLSRELSRETGGKQGGKLIVSLFAKMMDTLATDLMDDGLGIDIGGVKIPSLLFVDDNVSFAEGYEQQQVILDSVNEFAVKHKIEWGASKCKTMEIGNHKEKRTTWKLGNKEIEKCSTYRYLGEQISRNGKNNENLQERFEKVKKCVRAIMSCCKNDVMRRVGAKVALDLHEAVTISTLLYNSETWTLNKTEKNFMNRAEIYAIKKVLGLPKTTPTAGIVFSTGILFTSVRIEMKQLIFLQKILKKEENHWTRVTLMALKEQNHGWAKQIDEVLLNWELELDWAVIRAKTLREWKMEVKNAAENMNRQKILDECEAKNRGEKKQKTKTRCIEPIINGEHYKRKPDVFLQTHQSLIHAKAYIMGKYGMLECSNNYSNKHGGKSCRECDAIDDESHRINHCRRFENINRRKSIEKINFDNIHCDDTEKVMNVVRCILSMWDLERGKNETIMKAI